MKEDSMTLEIRGLKRRLPGFTLEIDHFQLEAGQFAGLLGENGAGKTTFLRCVTNFSTDYEGQILIGGGLYTGRERSIAAEIGYMSEEFRYIEDLTVAEHLELARSLSPRWDGSLSERLTRELRLERKKPVGRLSRGNRVKLGLVVALSRRPRLLLLDEPTSGLDPVAREVILRELQELKSSQASALISSHILDDIRELCDAITILKAGRMVARARNDRTLAELRSEVLDTIAAG